MSTWVWRSARSDVAKYLSGEPKRGAKKREKREYFELESNPGEKPDRSRLGPLPPKGRALRAQLERRRSMWKDDALAEPMPLDPTFLEGLKALGYIQESEDSGSVPGS